MGKLRKRMSFARSEEVLEMPNLIEVQRNSYRRFLEHDLKEVFDDVSPITDYNGHHELSFVGYTLEEPKDDLARCRERDKTYAAPLKVKARVLNTEKGIAVESDVYMGEFPLMTEYGTFLINGGDRVVVSQLVRSPGVYFSMELDKHGKPLYSAQLIPGRGAWLEYEIDSNDVVWIKIDRHPKQELTYLIRALGYATNAEIVELFGEDEHLKKTLTRTDMEQTVEAGLMGIYQKQKPGEPATVESSRQLFHNLFFDSKRYDLMRVGRYKYNKKLALFSRIMRRRAAEDIINPMTGELMVAEGETIDLETARRIQNVGINEVWVQTDSGESGKRKVIGNNFGYPVEYLPFDPAEAGISDMVYLPKLVELMQEAEGEEDLKAKIRENMSALAPKHILADDIIASVSYLLGLQDELGTTDDIDHLGNRRLRSVGELLQNQIRLGMSRMERTVRERMNTQDEGEMKAADLINIRPITAAIKEFFGASQLSQFMDQPNPLAELTHKRRLSALGPGGLSRDRASFQVRDVHYSHYARICPIETPEGPNIGLIGSLATYARINEYGFIEAPYRRVDKETGRVTDEIVYMTADEEDLYRIATANEPLNEDGTFVRDRVMVRQRADYIEVPVSQVDYIDVSPRQVVSVATAMIPFLENDDATRALMGSNMQRQAVPLLVPEAPFVGTGMEYRAAQDSGVVILARENGVVEKVSGSEIVIRDEIGESHVYRLTKFTRSNQSTCINQRPVVFAGQKVEKGDLLADGPATEKGEIGLGRNALIGFMTWEGYNYEDAVLLSEELVKNDVYTSIHIEDFECEARETKLGPEEITRDIPNVGEDALRDLDEEGIVRIGAEVKAGDILVGKVTPKGETEPTAEERLLRAIFGEKACDVRDTSLKVPHGEGGIVVDVKIFTRANGDEVSPGVNKLVRIYLAQKRKISVGDKMSGRHGNKGVVSRILREEDMPFLPDGTPLQIVLNPMGVPSRMNIGQVMEVHLGMACRALGWHIATPVFDGATYEEIRETLRKAGLREDGKAILRDGRTGDEFENPVTVGVMYFLKLHHLVDDKMHARSTGPYALVTQQPLGGKAQFGGQRFGEMEVWALEAYGAAHTLQEILTVKSDDVVGREKTYSAIIKGQNIPDPRVPESFKVLVKELQALCLDIKVLDQDGGVVEIPELDPEDMAAPDSRNRLMTRQDAEGMESGTQEEGMEETPLPEEEFDEGLDDGFLDDDSSLSFDIDPSLDDDDLIE